MNIQNSKSVSGKTIDNALFSAGTLLIAGGLYLSFAPDREGLNVLEKFATTTDLHESLGYFLQIIAAKSEIITGGHLIDKYFTRRDGLY